MVEIYTLRDFTTRDAEQNGAFTILAGGAVGFESEACFLRVRRLDEDELVVPDLVEDAHALPHGDDLLHVEVRWEKHNDAVWCDLCEFKEQSTVVADDAWVGADLEAGGNRLLVGATGDNQR